MCKLIVAIKDETKPNKELSKLISNQWEALETQKDGCSALVIYNDGSFEVKRELIDYDAVKEFVSEREGRAKLISIHSRTSTSGGVKQENVHFFEDRGVLIAHNGWLEGKRFFNESHNTASEAWDHGVKESTIVRQQMAFGDDDEVELVIPMTLDQIMAANEKKLTVFKDTIKHTTEDFKIITSLRKKLDHHLGILENCNKCSWYEMIKYETCKRHKDNEKHTKGLEHKIGKYVFGKDFKDDDFDFLAEDDKYLIRGRSSDETRVVQFGDGQARDNDWRAKKTVDTLDFLKAIPRPITGKGITKTMESEKFTGVAIIFDTNTNEIWLVCERKWVYVADQKGYMAIFSYKPNKLIENKPMVKERSGIIFECPSPNGTISEDSLGSIPDGVHKVDIGLKIK